MSSSSSPSPLSSSSSSSTENLKVLKHVNDIRKLTQESPRSEKVKGVSLDDIISEKGITAPPPSGQKRTLKLNNGSEGKRSDAVDGLSLAQIIADKKIMAPPPHSYKNKGNKGSWGNNKGMNGSSANGDDVCGLEKQQGNSNNDGKSLDDIIAEKKKATIPNGNGIGGHDGSDHGSGGSVEENGVGGSGAAIVPFIAAPLDVLMALTDKGLVIQCEIGRLAEGLDGPGGRMHNWRVKFSCGEIAVRCDSPRKNLAKQGAAFQFLTELKEARADLEIPPFKIPEACYYDPVVVNRLEEVIGAMCLGPARFETTQTRMSKHDYFTTTFFINGDEFIESAFDPDHSKLLAAKRAYEVFSMKKFPRDSFVVNEKCAPCLEYDIRETEATHVITLAALADMDEEQDVEIRGEGGSTIISRKRPAIRKPQPQENKICDPDEAEMFVDESGQMYVRATDGSNKIRKICPVTLEDYANLATMEFPQVEEEEEESIDDVFDPMTLMNGDLLGGIDDFDYDDL